jgi:hypothetical protein
MSSANRTPSQADIRTDVLAVFADHLIEAFQMPAEEAVERVNCELRANPATRHFQLQLRPDHPCFETR